MDPRSLADALCCPWCGKEGLQWADADSEIRCTCGRRIPVRDSVIDLTDLAGSRSDPEISMTFSQAAMRWMPLVKVYNLIWRRLTFPFVTWIPFSVEQRIVLGYHALHPSYRLLDIACGPGTYTREFARLIGEGGMVVGVDASMEMLLQAARTAKAQAGRRAGPAAPWFIRAAATRLPFRPRTFDGVNCTGALHLFDTPDAVFERIHAVLKPGGVLSCMTLCRTASGPLEAISERLGIRLFDIADLKERLERKGLAVEEATVSRRMVLFRATART
jgi:SAM-dependent methyltransferase